MTKKIARTLLIQIFNTYSDLITANYKDGVIQEAFEMAIEALRKTEPQEISEDCISKHDIWKIIEDNAYWVRYNENSTEKGMTLTGINQALNECPPVIPTVNEDCISREWVRENMLKYGFLAPDMTVTEFVADAPSVVPTTEQSSMVGEWENYKDEHRCSECGEVVIGDWYDDEWYDYCPNCGAKMRLE